MREGIGNVLVRQLFEELGNIVKNAPVFPGDTISHRTSYALEELGLIKRNVSGDWVPTDAGRIALKNSKRTN